jgi:hypothetical protein
MSCASLLSTYFAAIVNAIEAGEDVNEVEAAGNTPLHFAAYVGWLEGCELLLSLGAKANASNNAGDRPWHWAQNMGHADVMEFLEKVSDIYIPTHPHPTTTIPRKLSFQVDATEPCPPLFSPRFLTSASLFLLPSLSLEHLAIKARCSSKTMSQR